MSHCVRPRAPRPVVVSSLVGLIVASVVGVAVSGPSTAADESTSANAKLVIQPGHEAAVPVSSAFVNGTAGVTFQVPQRFDTDLSVGLVLRAGRNASKGYRLSVRLGPGATVTETISRVRNGKSSIMIAKTLHTAWQAGDLIHIEGKVGGASKVALKMRAWAESEDTPTWHTSKKDASGKRITARGRALAWGALTPAASAAVTVGVLPLSATSTVTITEPTSTWIPTSTPTASPTSTPTPDPTPTSTPDPSPTSDPTPTPTPEPVDEFGPIGRLPNSADVAALGWNGIQSPQDDSITVLGPEVPLGTNRPPGTLLRAKLEAGETYSDGRCRAEVYGRRPSPWSTPAAQWPDPAGSERWYSFSLFVPEGFPVAADTRWLDLMQWKGYRGGTPPMAIEIKRNRLRFGGSRANSGLIPEDGRLGTITPGEWTRITVGIHFSTSATDGWVEVYHDGQPAIARTAVATMDTYQGGPDPVYLKQGLYRSAAWDVKQVLYFSQVAVSDTRPSLP